MMSKESTKIFVDDQGSLEFVMGVKDGKIVIHFGALLKWFAMAPSEARRMAQRMLELSEILEKGESDADRTL